MSHVADDSDVVVRTPPSSAKPDKSGKPAVPESKLAAAQRLVRENQTPAEAASKRRSLIGRCLFVLATGAIVLVLRARTHAARCGPNTTASGDLASSPE